MKTSPLTLRLALCLAALGFAPIARSAVAVISDDAYVSTARAKDKLGGSNTLIVGKRERSFLRFDLSALPAGLASEQVAKATLRLWVQHVTRAGNVHIAPVAETWSELTVTERTAPIVDASDAAVLPLVEGRKKYYVSVEVTGLVREWVSGQRENYGIALLSDVAGAGAFFDSKENAATSHEPHLEIVLAGPEGREGQQGIAGLDGKDGKDGKDGNDGTPGLNGMNGLDGAPGKDGKDGQDGASGPQGPPGPIITGTAQFVGINDPAPAGYVETGLSVANWRSQQLDSTGQFNGPIFSVNGRAFVAGQGIVREFSLVTGLQISQVTVSHDHADAAFDGLGTVYFFGGNPGGGWQATVVAYDPISGSSSPLPPMPSPLISPSAVYLNGSAYVFDQNGTNYRYDVASQQWSGFPSVSFPGGPNLPAAYPTAVGNSIVVRSVGQLMKIVPGMPEWTPIGTPVAAGLMVPVGPDQIAVLDGGDRLRVRVVNINTGSVIESSRVPEPILQEGAIGIVNSEVVIFGESPAIFRAPLTSFRRLLMRE